MRPLLIGFAVLIGLVIGSFVSVVVYRVPRRESVVSPRSSCPKCGASIANRDNVPVFSWLALRGRCRFCHEPISIRYPLIELTAAGLFGLIALRFGFNWVLPAYLVLAAGLLSLACVDLERHLLPARMVYPMSGIVAVLLVMAAGATDNWHGLFIAATCGFVWFAMFFAINYTSPRLLGFGDVRLAPVLGLSLGWLGIPVAFVGFFLSNFIGALVGLVLIATKRISRETPVPYGVFLAAGTLTAILTGPFIVSHFRGLR